MKQNLIILIGIFTINTHLKGTLFAHGGEGSSRWFFVPENKDLPGGSDFYEGMRII